MEVPTASAIKEDDYKSEMTQSKTFNRQQLLLSSVTGNSSPLPATKNIPQAIMPIKKRPQRQGAQRLLKTRRTDFTLALTIFPVCPT